MPQVADYKKGFIIQKAVGKSLATTTILLEPGTQALFFKEVITDLGIPGDQHGHPGIVLAQQIGIAINIDLRVFKSEFGAQALQCLHHIRTEMTAPAHENGQPGRSINQHAYVSSGTLMARKVGLPLRCNSTATDLPADSPSTISWN